MEIRTVAEWDAAWDAALDSQDTARLGKLAFDILWLPRDDHSSVLYNALLRAFRRAAFVRGCLNAVAAEADVAWNDWNDGQRMALLEAAFTRLDEFSEGAEVALIGDWASEGPPLPKAKRWMVEMIRRRPEWLGDVLFSMRSRLFPRFTPAEREAAMELHRRLYGNDENDPEVFAREHEKLWGMVA